MSGFFALLSSNGRRIPQDLALQQLKAMAYRADRAPRSEVLTEIALGQANFATTLEAERELLPACDQSGRFWLVWDGRLDNRENLSRQLGLDVATLERLTDADLVLASYSRWGAGCVNRLLGEWAIVIWDAVAKRLFCAKDPMGSRPLYFGEHDGLGAARRAAAGVVQGAGARGLILPDPPAQLRHAPAFLQHGLPLGDRKSVV